jgi:hypothetical protein
LVVAEHPDVDVVAGTRGCLAVVTEHRSGVVVAAGPDAELDETPPTIRRYSRISPKILSTGRI